MDRRSGSSFSNGTATSPVRNSSTVTNGRLSSTANGRMVLTPNRTSASPTRSSSDRSSTGNGTVRSPTRVSTSSAQSDRVSTVGSPRGSSVSRARTPSASRMSSSVNEDQMYARRQDSADMRASEVRGRSATRTSASPTRSPIRNGSVLNTTVRQPTSRSPSPVRNVTSAGLTRTTAPRASSPTRVSTLGSRRSVGSMLPNRASTAGTTTLAELRARASTARSPSRSPVRSPTRASSLRSPAVSPTRNGTARSPSRSPVRSPTRASSLRSPAVSPSRASSIRASSAPNRDTNAMLVCLLNGLNLNDKMQCVMVDLKSGYKAAQGISETVFDIINDLDDRKIFRELLNSNGLSAELKNLSGKVFTLFAPSDKALYKVAGGSTPSEAARNISNYLRTRGVDVKSWLMDYISPFNFRQSHLRSLIDQGTVLQTQNNNMHSVARNDADDSIVVDSARIQGSGRAQNGTVYLVDDLFESQQ